VGPCLTGCGQAPTQSVALLPLRLPPAADAIALHCPSCAATLNLRGQRFEEAPRQTA
jgi:hypothetical protein